MGGGHGGGGGDGLVEMGKDEQEDFPFCSFYVLRWAGDLPCNPLLLVFGLEEFLKIQSREISPAYW